jgi:hypothetical protein
MRLGPLIQGLGAGAKTLRGINAQEEAARAAEAERQRKRTLEDALQERQAREFEMDTKSRTLDDLLKQTQIDAAKNPAPKAPVPGTEPYFQMREREAAITAKHRAPSSDTPKPAEFEKKAAFVLEGAESAAKTLDGYKAPASSFVRNVPGLGNYGLTDQDQVAQQAAETLADAYLRLTTGATITPEEVKNTAKQMVPVPGDGDDVLVSKKQRREQVIRAIRAAAMPGRVSKPDAVPDHTTMSDEEFAKAYRAGAFKKPGIPR